MRIQRTMATLLAITVLALAACAGGPGTGGLSAADVQPKIESAAKVKLVTQPAAAGQPAGAAVLSNTTSMITDLQLVMVVVADTADNAKKIADGLAPALSASGGQAKTYASKNVIVVYAALPGGTDNSAAVEAAVKGL